MSEQPETPAGDSLIFGLVAHAEGEVIKGPGENPDVPPVGQDSEESAC